MIDTHVTLITWRLSASDALSVLIQLPTFRPNIQISRQWARGWGSASVYRDEPRAPVARPSVRHQKPRSADSLDNNVSANTAMRDPMELRPGIFVLADRSWQEVQHPQQTAHVTTGNTYFSCTMWCTLLRDRAGGVRKWCTVSRPKLRILPVSQEQSTENRRGARLILR